VAGLQARVHLVGLGSGADRLPATDFSDAGSGFGALLPAATQTLVAPARHFSLLPVCTPKGPAILKDEGDDPVCTDPPGADRAAIHAQVAAAVRQALWP
jgi:predicted dienelactone hydrolase